MNGQPTINSWKALRDFRIVKQQRDYSCGAAGLATILNEFYGMSVTEEDVLTRMGATDRASFQQLAEVAPSYGVKAGGIMLSFDYLNPAYSPKPAPLAALGGFWTLTPSMRGSEPDLCYGWLVGRTAVPDLGGFLG